MNNQNKNETLEKEWREHLKNDVHMHRKDYDKLIEKLKSLEQENKRLRSRGLNEAMGEMKTYYENQLKEREEMIKEAIPLIESKIYTITNEEWLEKANKLIGREG